MPTCFVSGCTSGCRGNSEKRKFFKPDSESCTILWEKVIPHDGNFTATSRVCDKHFHDDDIIKEEFIINLPNGQKHVIETDRWILKPGSQPKFHLGNTLLIILSILYICTLLCFYIYSGIVKPIKKARKPPAKRDGCESSNSDNGEQQVSNHSLIEQHSAIIDLTIEETTTSSDESDQQDESMEEDCIEDAMKESSQLPNDEPLLDEAVDEDSEYVDVMKATIPAGWSWTTTPIVVRLFCYTFG